MQRVISAWLPTWSVDLRTRANRHAPTPPETPDIHLVVATRGPRRIVTTPCPRARAAGVTPGLTLADARARLPRDHIHIHEDDPPRTLRALNALARHLHRHVPLVAPDPPDGLFMDVTGCARLYRGEPRLITHLHAEFQRLGIRARLAIASTPGAAWALARHARHIPLPTDDADPLDETEALRPLPVRALRLEADALDRLREVGIHTIGELMQLPRRTIPARFGDHTLLRLDQARGHAFELIDPVRHEDPITAEREFTGPTTRLDAILLCTRELIEEITATLRRLERAALILTITLHRVDAAPLVLPFTFSHPCRDVRHVWARVQPRLERACLADGVEGITLDVPRAQRIQHAQFTHWDAAPRARREDNDRHLGAMIDTLIDRLGDRRVWRATPRASHIPEEAFARTSARVALPPARVAPVAAPPRNRPTLVIDPPRPVRLMVVTPDGPVVHLRIAEHDQRRILTTIGPERIGPEWWTAPPGATQRDFFTVQDDAGRWLWLCRELNTNRWLLAGEWT